MVSEVAPRLKSPPIVEVICGFFFSPIAEIDPMIVGKYWSEHKEKLGNPRFPTKQILPPVVDRAFTLDEGVGPLRCWLISETDEYLIQIQPNRFYFNWRKRDADYPHFNTHNKKEGVLDLALKEFEDFSKFCENTLGQILKPARLELAKMDLFEQGKVFRDFTDLASWLPVVDHAVKITRSAEPMLHLKLADFRDGYDIQFQLTSAEMAAEMSSALRLETRATGDAGDIPLKKSFIKMNEIVNEVFDGFIGQQYDRFQGVLQ